MDATQCERKGSLPFILPAPLPLTAHAPVDGLTSAIDPPATF